MSSGLDNIIEQIEQDALKKAEEIKARAQQEADMIIESAEKEGQEKAQIVVDEALKNAENKKLLASSNAELMVRNAVLVAKTKAIDEVLDESFKRLNDMPVMDYLSFIQKQIVAESRKGEGIIYFSSRDLKRLPPAFLDSVNDKLAKKGSHLTLSNEPRDMTGGFIMEFGDIEENCTFDALFASKRDELSDTANRVLFSEYKIGE